MSKIEQLIKQYCPDGVKFVCLKECCVFRRGSTITQKDAVEGLVPVIAGGKKPAYYHNKSNRQGTSITIAGSGAYAGFVSYWEIPIYVSDAFTVEPKDKSLSFKWLYYYLNNNQDKIHNTKKGSGVPHVHPSSIWNMQIPLPPLPIQEKIAKILDKFSLLSAELEAELEMQKKRYDFYRNRILSFDSDSDTVQWKPLGEVFEMRNGYTPSKANDAFWTDGTIPWYRMEDIREHGRILKDSIQHITSSAIKGKGLFKSGSIILATTATIGEHALLIADSLANQRFTNLQICKSLKNNILPKFVFYYMFIVDDFCKKHTNVSGFESVDMEALRNMPFPIPPLAEQERIVNILDRFEALVTDLEKGLPAEIERVRKQYEYYRNLLLTFPIAEE